MASRYRLLAITATPYCTSSVKAYYRIMKPYTHYHKDGTVWAKGFTTEGLPTGYWEWFRKDGTKLRSGHFNDGKQVGEWTTYDEKGEPHKVTQLTKSSDDNTKENNT